MLSHELEDNWGYSWYSRAATGELPLSLGESHPVLATQHTELSWALLPISSKNFYTAELTNTKRENSLLWELHMILKTIAVSTRVCVKVLWGRREWWKLLDSEVGPHSQGYNKKFQWMHPHNPLKRCTPTESKLKITQRGEELLSSQDTGWWEKYLLWSIKIY